MAETKLTSGKGEMPARIANRLRNSGCDGADIHTVHGSGPTRVHHNIYQKGQGANRALDMNPRTGKGSNGEVSSRDL